jgi:hypothetical protein
VGWPNENEREEEMRRVGLVVSVLGQVLEVQLILRAALGLLHLAQAGKRTDPHRDAEQLALNCVLSEPGAPTATPPITTNPTSFS